ncbi:Phospho-2-dehydro-3-deoxyheptonate aldolase [Penicillium angulare]|uniref:Phospho-2-dehydro-3-deoxyheptonate aldolase n=1 Tax=Penicillium angulare TaxID=116970 RepID=UPI002540FE2A|nr:Phospho-2-dehydro-3-deoxyheptonate aldolase [Penicillium angulare]KAJ5281619.1 Phospho-2-dehydro-3-deoxyheptonate aldolase [Penicillium angulare]
MSSQHTWTPSSWRDKTVNPYAIEYPNGKDKDVHTILRRLSLLPPLVTSSEASELRDQLREVALGQRFIWQCGDCAELFEYYEFSCLLFTRLTDIPTLLIGRMAGQYGKPRNGLMERVKGCDVQKFQGDVINSINETRRDPDPKRLLEAYFSSGCTLNYMRSTAQSDKCMESTTGI